MNCKEYQEVAIEALVEASAEPFPGDLQAHLGKCAACREEIESFRQLLVDLRAASVADPGELFFARQLYRIEEEVSQELVRRPLKRRWWLPTLAAAAVLVLLLGYSLFFRGPGVQWQAEWSTALQWLAQESGWGEEGVDLDDLNERQLNAYAEMMERRVLNSNEEAVDLDDPADWQDLDRQELDLLIERLQAGLGERHS